jgi:hypothetical protein
VPFGERFSLDWGDARDLLNHGIAHLHRWLTEER